MWNEFKRQVFGTRKTAGTNKKRKNGYDVQAGKDRMKRAVENNKAFQAAQKSANK